MCAARVDFRKLDLWMHVLCFELILGCVDCLLVLLCLACWCLMFELLHTWGPYHYSMLPEDYTGLAKRTITSGSDNSETHSYRTQGAAWKQGG